MNEAIGKLRLLELEPLKLAIMDALQRAWSFMPPLHVPAKEAPVSPPISPPIEHGFERKLDLKRAVDCLAIDDSELRELCDEFHAACETAGRKWFDARRYAEMHDLDASSAHVKTLYAQKPFEGETAVALIRDLYVKLSQSIEKALR